MVLEGTKIYYIIIYDKQTPFGKKLTFDSKAFLFDDTSLVGDLLDTVKLFQLHLSFSNFKGLSTHGILFVRFSADQF